MKKGNPELRQKADFSPSKYSRLEELMMTGPPRKVMASWPLSYPCVQESLAFRSGVKEDAVYRRQA